MNDTVAENVNGNVADGVAQGRPGAPPQNNNINNRRGGRSRTTRNGPDTVGTGFKGKVTELATLGTRDKSKVDSFLVFQKELHEHVLANYKFPSDIAYLVKEMSNPVHNLMKSIPTLSKLKKEWDMEGDESLLAEEEKSTIEDLKELLSPEQKAFVDRKSTLTQNLSKLYGLIWGQCTPKLKEDVMGMDEYEVKSNEYACLWLLEKVKATSSGADRAQYEYLSYIRALRNLSTCRQQDNESVETFQDRLVSSIQNFKLVGGNLMPQTLVTRERDEDLSLSAAQAGVIVENKIIGVLMVEAACDKDFREYKRSLQNSMSEGNNRILTTKQWPTRC